ncbi:radical SAM protein [Halioglobus japonicus]|uniref:Radical SAM protein n=2 Tax=Halioglobus japonicus TaxID=930805 RepID=A0AAP8MHJ3_9GAMM|nr:PA0069 family radical SAM protein [Halioglobus japonicus]PLW87927.1 radical SAM protein [Halioglobus japonicus]GHD20126.1 radical SAM protein [Halioglobus japonicus]
MSPKPRIIASQKSVLSGRGTASNHPPRFQRLTTLWEDGIEGPSPVTECRAVQASSIISRNTSPDIPFEQSINPYQGCEHGCIYCYARPTHAYHDLSPGLDFETRLSYKQNAAEVLNNELAKPGYQCRGITLGANTDPYQPVEKQLSITRDILQVLWETRHPVSIITKGALVTRDIDILAPMAAEGLASVAVSITTLDDDLKRTLEPRATSDHARLRTIASLSEAGIPVTLLASPMIPGLNDAEMERIVAASAEAGASSAAYMLLRLPFEVRDLFYEWLHEHYPLKAARIISLLRQCRSGKDYDSRFGHRMRGQGTYADLLSQRFRIACKKAGVRDGERCRGRTDLFTPPQKKGRNCAQIDMFS